MSSTTDATSNFFGSVALKTAKEKFFSEIKSIKFKKYKLKEIINSDSIQSIMDDFYKLTNIGVAILDMEGNILVATGWQRICTDFHRVNPETAKFCRKSDLFLSEESEIGKYKIYKCKNNIWDICTPIIVNDIKIGMLFLGQFLFEDEQVDNDYFRVQARKYNFNEEDYINALNEVPRFSKETIETVMSFYSKFAILISEIGFNNILLKEILAKKEFIFNLLKENEKKYQTLVNGMAEGLMMVDNNDKILFVNEQLCKMTGYRGDELRGKISYEIFLDKNSYNLIKEKNKLRESYVTDSYEVKFIKKNGESLWVKITGSPITDSSNKVIGSIGVLTDLTDKKKAENKLREWHNLVKYIIEHDPNAIAVFDTEMKYIFVSKRYLDDYNVEKQDVIGKHHYEVFPDIPQKWREVHKRVLQGSIEKSDEDIFIRKDGRTDYTRWECRPWYNPKGDIGGIITYTEVITQKKLAEERLKEKNDELEQLVYVTSHDLRSPLLNIQGFSQEIESNIDQITQDILEYLTDKDRSEDSLIEKISEVSLAEVREYLDFIKISAQKMDVLLNGLLHFSRQEKIKINITDIDPNKLVRDLIKNYDYLIREKKVTVAVENLPPCKADPYVLSGIFSNIFENSLKYLKLDCPGEIKIYGYKKDSKSIYAFQDNGLGIEKKNYKSIFQIFKRLQPKNISGEGLGLAVVKKNLSKLDGEIWVESELGQGSTFYISLPDR